MEINELNFESSRNKAILKILKDERDKYVLLQKDFKAKCSEFMVLKRQHLIFLEESAEERIKRAEQMIKLKQKNKFLKDQIKSLKQSLRDWELHTQQKYIENKSQREKDADAFNKLLEREQNKGWNQL